MKFAVLKNLKRKSARCEYRTWGGRLGVRALCSLRQPGMPESIHWLKFKLSYDVMYECSCNTMKSLKVIKITTFDQNQFMTCYLILNFKPTYFSYFRKITAISISHNVKKEVGPNGPFPVVRGLTADQNIGNFLRKLWKTFSFNR